MQFVDIPVKTPSRTVTDTFAGYNHNLSIADGEWYDMRNMSGKNFPLMSPRVKRGLALKTEWFNDFGKFDEEYNLQSNILAKGGIVGENTNICYTSYNKFYMHVGDDVYSYEFELSSGISRGFKCRIVSMGAYVIIFAHFTDGSTGKYYVNTASAYVDETTGEKTFSDAGYVEASHTSSHSLVLEYCDINGKVYPYSYTSDSEPTNPQNGQYWKDTSVTPYVVKRYNETTAMWTSVSTYLKVEFGTETVEDYASIFKQYDGVDISITSAATEGHPEKYINGVGTRYDDEYLDALEGTHTIYAVTKGGIVISGVIGEHNGCMNTVKISRKVPDMDYVCEGQNRLWGCKYGYNDKGELVNEIYASKLGDFKNWNCFMGLSTDSYTASCGTDGQWTGAINYGGNPMFFKENFVHKVYGNYPANFQIQDSAINGVEDGSSNSMVIINKVLYYKSPTGIVAYDNAIPTIISTSLGEEHYRNAVAGGVGNLYYVSMQNRRTNEWEMFAFDTAKGLWFKEDNLRVDAFCNINNELYFRGTDYEKEERSVWIYRRYPIRTINGSGTPDTDPVEWMVESGPQGTYLMSHKYVSRINVRISLDLGTIVRVYIQYDSSGEWENIATMTSSRLRTYDIPIRPKRCDHYKLRIYGRGEAKIFSIQKTLKQGSERR